MPYSLLRRFAAPITTVLLVGLTASVCPAQPALPSPFDLMIAPADGVEYFQMRRRAFALARDHRYAAAEPLVDQLTREFPRDGENWHLLGQVKAALGKHREAAIAYERAGSILGWYDPYWADRNAAYSYVDAGDHAAALLVLDRAVFQHHALYRGALFEYPRLAPLRTNAEFRRIAGRPSVTGMSRTEGWQLDIDHLRAEVQRINPDYRDRDLPETFTKTLDSVRRNVSTMSTDQIVVGINRALATLRQGHTGLWFWPADSGRNMPIEIAAFPDGIYITGAPREHTELLHKRLVSIESTAAIDALRAINSIMSIDGDMELISVSMVRMQDLRLLRGLGFLERVDSVRIVVENDGGTQRSITLAAEQTRQPKVFSKPGAAPAPVYLKHSREMHWDTLLTPGTMYVQVNNILDAQDEPLAQFGLRLRKRLNAEAPGNLILDIRRNSGGSTDLYTELLRTVVAFTTQEDKQLFVIIGRTTYSAAANFATDLERLARPVFVGEPTGECCNLHGDFTNIRLPYSQMRGRLTGVHWNRSTPWDGRREIVPHIPVQVTARDMIDGRDPVLDAVLRVIAAKSPD